MAFTPEDTLDTASTADLPGERRRLLLADNHEEFRDAAQRLLADHFDIVALAQDGLRLVEAAAEVRPDAVVTDFRLPGLNGVQAARRLISNGLCANVVLLTVYNDSALVFQAFESGIRGYVLKTDAGAELIPALLSVMRGATYLSMSVRRPRRTS